MAQQKAQRNPLELYRLGTILFAATSVISFITLYLFVLTDKPEFYVGEIADFILGFVLLAFSTINLVVLFGIVYMLKALKEAEKKPEEKTG